MRCRLIKCLSDGHTGKMADWCSNLGVSDFEGHSLPTLPYFLTKKVEGKRTDGSIGIIVLFKLVDKSNFSHSLYKSQYATVCSEALTQWLSSTGNWANTMEKEHTVKAEVQSSSEPFLHSCLVESQEESVALIVFFNMWHMVIISLCKALFYFTYTYLFFFSPNLLSYSSPTKENHCN